jgi:(2R)-sulfolactate sulfo-lyase subunit alpha
MVTAFAHSGIIESNVFCASRGAVLAAAMTELVEFPLAQRPADKQGASMIHFVVHDEHDSVGVVVVEGVKSGQQLTGWIMDQDKEIKVRAQSDIPIGHKLAIAKLAADDTVIKYGTDIGRTVAPIKVGEHAHVHNIKTKRW